jgi:hypothetical protein
MRALLNPLLFACMLLPVATANDYDEAIDGDLSDQRFNPTCFDLEVGINRLTATQQGTASGFPLDRDYMTIIIPPGLVLAELRVTAYDNPTDPAFIGFQEGTRFVGAPILITAGDLLGGHVYGDPDIGTDILPAMNALPGVQGFPVPLPAGSYSFWLNQVGAQTTATFEFELIRETTGTGYCTVPPNSTGVESVLIGFGSPQLAENAFAVAARNLPPGEPAMVLASRAPGFVAMAGGSLGNLCLGGEVGRFPGTLMSDASGALELPIDWNELPMPNGSTVAAVGETWHFQVWHREGTGASHFTPGWSVLIE